MISEVTCRLRAVNGRHTSPSFHFPPPDMWSRATARSRSVCLHGYGNSDLYFSYAASTISCRVKLHTRCRLSQARGVFQTSKIRACTGTEDRTLCCYQLRSSRFSMSRQGRSSRDSSRVCEDRWFGWVPTLRTDHSISIVSIASHHR